MYIRYSLVHRRGWGEQRALHPYVRARGWGAGEEAGNLSQLYAPRSHGTSKPCHIKGEISSAVLILGTKTFSFAYGTKRPWVGSENQQHKRWSREVVVGQGWGTEQVPVLLRVAARFPLAGKLIKTIGKKKQCMCPSVSWCSTARWATFLTPSLNNYLCNRKASESIFKALWSRRLIQEMLALTANLVIMYRGVSGEPIFAPQQIKQEKNQRWIPQNRSNDGYLVLTKHFKICR